MPKILEYKCPCCGGAISFESDIQKMKCPYCDTEFDVETLKAYDQDLASASEKDRMEWENPGKVWQEGDEQGMRLYVCNSCGGQILGDATLGATFCPYCGNPVIMSGQFAGDLMPDLIIPFKLDKETAKKQLLEHYKKMPFLPKEFTEGNHIDEIRGLYVPFWLFNTTAHGKVHYKATKIRTWTDTRFVYTDTSFFSVTREGNLRFNGIPADGSSKMPDDITQSIEPFDFSEAVDFQTAYMSGYLADRYDVEFKDCIPYINERVKNSVIETFQGTVQGFNTVNIEDSFVSTQNGAVRYAMCPVWILNTTWKDRKYIFAMNGQTGKMVGNTPIDKKKVWLKGILYAFIAAAAVLAAEIFLHMLGIF